MAILDTIKKLKPSLAISNPSLAAVSGLASLVNAATKNTKTNQVPNQSMANQSSFTPTKPTTPATVATPRQNIVSTAQNVALTPTVVPVPPPKPVPEIRPITPAPTMLTDKKSGTSKPMSDDELQMSILRKSLKQQYGDSLTDDELSFIAKRNIENSKAKEGSLSEFEKAQQEQLKKLNEITLQEEASINARQAELDERNRLALEQFKNAAEARSQEDIALVEKYGKQNIATTERLLGSRGNLTSTVGTQSIGEIEDQTARSKRAILESRNAEIMLKQAELEGASREEIRQLRGNLQQIKQNESQAILNAESALQNAKLEATRLGDEAKLELLNNALSNLSIEKVKSKANAELTKNINDGFVYDEFGQRVTDAEGNFMTYDSAEELDDFITLKQGDILIDPATGQPVYQAPQKAEFQKIGDETYQVVNGQLVPINEPQSSQKQTQAITQAREKTNLINEILNDPNFDDVFGLVSSRVSSLNPSAQQLKNKVDNLIGDLILDERGRLKGSGAISDFETRIIRQAASPLGTNLKEDQAKQVLSELKSKFDNVEKGAYLSQTLGMTQDDAALFLENIKQQTGRYPTIEELQQSYPSFNGDLGTSQNYQTNVSSIKDFSKVTTSIGKGTATGIQAGSPLWKWGYDFVLEGGKGAPVKSPVSGTVVMARKDGGFGNRVGIKDSLGREWYFGHLDSIPVREGQRLSAGSFLGPQGNTGKTLGKTGVHVDITVKKPDGSYYTSQEVASLLGTKLA